MSWESLVAVVVIAAVLYALARNLAGPDVILLGGAVFLVTLSLVSDAFPGPGQLAAAFGNEGLLTVAVLYVVTVGLTETGATSLATERLLGRPQSLAGAQLRMMLPVAGISAFLNNTPVVAMFIPVVNDWCQKIRLSPSKLFIPLSYAAILGGLGTLIGTSTNLVVQGMMIQAQRTDPTMPRMEMFTLAPVGFPAAVVGIVFILVVSGRWLPERRAVRARIADARQYTIQMEVMAGGPMDGVTIERAGLRHLPGVFLSSIERDEELLPAVGPEEVLRGGDRLEFVGIVDSVVHLNKMRGLVAATNQVHKLNAARDKRTLVEAVVSDTSPVAGKTVREGRFRTRYDAAIIAVHRNGERVAGKIGDIVLRPGDTLLIEAHPRFVSRHRHSRDFFLISSVADSQPRRHDRAWIAAAILVGMVLTMTFEEYTGVGVFNAALIAAGLMGLTGCCTADQARRSIDLSVIVAIAAALTIGRAMETTGLAALSANALIDGLRAMGPHGVLAGIYAITLIFTELVTNNAAAALSFPIAHAAAASLDVNFMPFAVTICLAASAGFATPLGYQTHLMVYGPGGYRFSDFVRVGVPLDLVVMAVAVVLAPMAYPF